MSDGQTVSRTRRVARGMELKTPKTHVVVDTCCHCGAHFLSYSQDAQWLRLLCEVPIFCRAMHVRMIVASKAEAVCDHIDISHIPVCPKQLIVTSYAQSALLTPILMTASFILFVAVIYLQTLMIKVPTVPS